MPILVLADVSRTLVAGINLAGLVLGVLGSLFFTYDLLGRPGGPLRWFLRVVLPSGLGAAVALALVVPVAWWGFGAAPGKNAGTLAAFAYAGSLLGAYNGLFVDAPGVVRSRRVVSPADGVVGGVLGAGAGLLALQVLPTWPHLALTTQTMLLFAVVAGLAGGMVASIWRSLNRDRHNSGAARPPLFSRRGCVLGGVAALLLPAAVYSVLLVQGDTAAVLSPYTLPTVAIVAVAGGVIGGLSRSIFWWVNTLPQRSLEVIGVLLILLAFVIQAVEPVLTLVGVAVR